MKVARSRTGDADRGAKLFEGKCNRCHGREVAKVKASGKTMEQWSRYFASGRHKYRAPLKGIVSLSELADIKAYLMANAADADSDIAAGVR